MKYKNILIIAFGAFCFLVLASFDFAYIKGESKNEIQLVASSSKDTYLLGEVIPLVVEVNNLTGKEIVLTDTLDPIYGSLKLYVSNENKTIEYQYMNPKSGILDVSGFIKIKAGEKRSNSVQVLAKLRSYNQAEYFFDSAGTYYLQASYQIQLIGQTKPIEIKSEPIKITINEPKGEDLEVWNKIKDNGDFAYFIQEGEILIPIYKTEERAKFQQEVEQILIDYPNSFYATSLRQSLDKFKASEAKRLEFQEKMKAKP